MGESKSHGWPSFRDSEVNWDYVRVLADGECVSVDGTHLGHNLPDRSGNRYCINLVSVAGSNRATCLVAPCDVGVLCEAARCAWPLQPAGRRDASEAGRYCSFVSTLCAACLRC